MVELQIASNQEPVCFFEKSCKAIGGPLECQLDTAVNTFFRNRRQFKLPDNSEVLDSILANMLYSKCPLFYDISSYALDRLEDPARYRWKVTNGLHN